jgi:protein phosphatase 1 regulatory subunit 7
LRNLKLLEEIDLYDNRLKSVRGLEGLDNLTSVFGFEPLSLFSLIENVNSDRSLDLSFNLLRSISPLVDESEDSLFAYPLLTHLYLIQNKLSVIEGVKHRDSLVYLEFGGNRIRVREFFPISRSFRR